MTGYDFLKFLTVNIEGSISTGKEQNDYTATGFYAIINDDTVLVTAKHFTEHIDSAITVPVHYKENNTIVTIPVTACVEWSWHNEYDIAYCSIQPIMDKFREITGKAMYYTAISKENIITKSELNQLSVLSKVIATGYPNSIGSTHHQFPLFKTGYISSSPKNFAEDGEGFLELTAEEGFSGSPVILNNSELKLIGIIIRGNPGASTTTYIPAYELLNI